MKKLVMGVAIFFIIGLLVSSATAVPQTYSTPSMEIINKIEQTEKMIEELEVTSTNKIFETNGIIDWIIQLIQSLIDFVINIIQFVVDLMGIVNLIQNLIDTIYLLFEYIGLLIELISNIFNPSI
jgi:phage-related protein